MEFHLLIETNTNRKIKTDSGIIYILLLIIQCLLNVPSTSEGRKTFYSISNDLDMP